MKDGKKPAVLPAKLEHDLKEAQLCAEMIRRGLGRIQTKTSADGNTFRYTEITVRGGMADGIDQ